MPSSGGFSYWDRFALDGQSCDSERLIDPRRAAGASLPCIDVFEPNRLRSSV
jgi:hypothetical protein